jgi:uncharacterized protein (TIGR00369 family)
MRRPIVFAEDGRCFGCGADNPQGLRLSFIETDDGVEVEYSVPSHLEGARGIVHGGIQATLLDEALCMTAYAKLGYPVMTGELTVRYVRPAPSATPLIVWGRISEARDNSAFIEGGIRHGATGEELTRASGRFFRWKE